MGEDEKKMVVLRLYDENLHSIYVVKTVLTEKELSKLVREVVDEIFETNWCYEDIIEELEKRGAIERVNADFCEIYVPLFDF
ncbi:hypothetical protein Ferp_0531 [Ferroglobus placidus DSM 10642]|uniref:Uncharacterized protein n=1 Tax=Ferroglobus placidus (strain DSM 10642 / AEDII12DO) TaxID=589924 RepID=D3S372_FERPA|nr:hypothetical protein [Ferroglobus placidus]ADC64705.1 hypothetical protein Ferp_0531 [Ferroglobus placidus DSM 10642]